MKDKLGQREFQEASGIVICVFVPLKNTREAALDSGVNGRIIWVYRMRWQCCKIRGVSVLHRENLSKVLVTTISKFEVCVNYLS